MSAIEVVRFHGDEIQAVRGEGDEVWVVLRRLCEAVGVRPHGQAQKLKTKEWATTQLICAVAEDGKDRELLCLSLDSVPMWLGGIETARVNPERRHRLIAYQRECARVLRDHFFGRPTTISPSILDRVLEQQSQTLVLLRTIVERHTDLEKRVSEMERPGFSHGAISHGAYLQLQGSVRRIAQTETSTGKWKSVRAATADIHRELRETTNWGGKAKPWHLLPAQLEQPAMAVLRRRLCEAERLAGSRQGQFAFAAGVKPS